MKTEQEPFIMKLQVLMIFCIVTFVFSFQYQKGPINKKLTLVSIDTVPPYFCLRFIEKIELNKIDSVTVLSLIHPKERMSKNDSSSMIQFDIGRSYQLEVSSTNSILTTEEAKVETFLNGMKFYLNGKLLIRDARFPFTSRDVYRTYYLKRD